jgi:immune inhibitor A
LFVVLPQKEVTTEIGSPYAGSYFYYSGSGNNLDNLMYKSFNLPAGSSLTAQVNFDIEVDWDYAYVVVSTDGGANWSGVPTNFSTPTNPNGQNLGYGITGSSGGWAALTADLSGYTGDVLLGFRYWTDGAVGENGLMVDEISVNGSAADGAEADAGWTFDGFRVSTGTESRLYNNYYVAMTKACGMACTTSVSWITPPWVTGSNISPTRTVCWSATGTPHSRTTTPRSIPVKV